MSIVDGHCLDALQDIAKAAAAWSVARLAATQAVTPNTFAALANAEARLAAESLYYERHYGVSELRPAVAAETPSASDDAKC